MQAASELWPVLEPFQHSTAKRLIELEIVDQLQINRIKLRGACYIVKACSWRMMREEEQESGHIQTKVL